MSAPGAGRWLAIAAAVAVAAAVTAAIFAMGGPSAQRAMRLDERRIADLARIVRDVRGYYDSHRKLPPDLATLSDQPGRRARRDPGTGAPYPYEIVDARRFRLCAAFSTDTAQTPEGDAYRGDEDWSHPAGRHCFERSAATKQDD